MLPQNCFLLSVVVEKVHFHWCEVRKQPRFLSGDGNCSVWGVGNFLLPGASPSQCRVARQSRKGSCRGCLGWCEVSASPRGCCVWLHAGVGVSVAVVVLLLPFWSNVCFFSGWPCCCKVNRSVQMGLWRTKHTSQSSCYSAHMACAAGGLVLARGQFLGA